MSRKQPLSRTERKVFFVPRIDGMPKTGQGIYYEVYKSLPMDLL